MLIGVQNSSRTLDVPSDSTLVHPLDLRHWSSAFGDENILDFRVQIATSKSWSDTKAHWYALGSPGAKMFLVCPPLGNMARKQCFLVECFLV